MFNFWHKFKKRIVTGGAIAAVATTGMMHPAGLDLVKHFEGGCDGPAGQECRSYIDKHATGGNLPTIGYGHTNRAGTVKFNMGEVWTEEYASEVLDIDLKSFWDAVDRAVTVPLTQCQQSVLTSWTHNVGPNAMRTSTLVRNLNKGDYKGVPAQLMRWTRADGKKLTGLERRRAAEGQLWRTNCGDN